MGRRGQAGTTDSSNQWCCLLRTGQLQGVRSRAGAGPHTACHQVSSSCSCTNDRLARTKSTRKQLLVATASRAPAELHPAPELHSGHPLPRLTRKYQRQMKGTSAGKSQKDRLLLARRVLQQPICIQSAALAFAVLCDTVTIQHALHQHSNTWKVPLSCPMM